MFPNPLSVQCLSCAVMNEYVMQPTQFSHVELKLVYTPVFNIQLAPLQPAL